MLRFLHTFYSCVILNDYKTTFLSVFGFPSFYSCVILNDYKTYFLKGAELGLFYSCVILNDYKTTYPPKPSPCPFYSCVILNVMRREKIIFIIGLRNRFALAKIHSFKVVLFCIGYLIIICCCH